jgi:Ser/Thr protein kinase RdoA (MazF antagonist)
LLSDFHRHLPISNSWEARILLAVERLPKFLDFLGDRLSTPRRSLYERALSSANQAWKPTATSPTATLLHGDAHLWNFLFPADLTTPALLVDWNSSDIGRPTDDLAYMIGLHWYRDRRASLERPLLEYYHASLPAASRPAHALSSFFEDYRHSLVMNLFVPVWQWNRGIHPSVWWHHLERAFLAFDDWACTELLP